MPWSESLYWWLVYSALVSLVVLAIGSTAVLLCRQPARRLRIIELSLAGCLIAPLLGMIPGYPQLTIVWRHAAPPQPQAISTPLPTGQVAAPVVSQPEFVLHSVLDMPPIATGEPTETPARAWNVSLWLVGLYFLGVAIGIAWWLVGMAALVRIISTARAAPPHCRQLLAQIAGRRSARVRLLTSRLAKQPFVSVGVAVQLPPRRAAWGRAVIVLPENLCDDEQAVRWALAHEWTHIERRDFRAWFVAGLARVLFFYQPLVWWLRRQLRLCQDYVADALASRQAAQPEDYAEFLTRQAAAGFLHPAMVGLGMGFSKSELYRRVVMLVQNRPLESRPPRLWTVSVTCAALLLVATVAALTISPRRATGSGSDANAGVTGPANAASSGDARKSNTSSPDAGKTRGTPADRTNDNPQAHKPAKAKITLESLGFVTMSTGPGNDEETEKLIKEKKYEFVKTFDSGSGEKQYVYRFTYPDGRRVNRNFSMPLDKVTSWADYEKKEELQSGQRNERISQALTSGRFRLLNLEVMQIHICRDVASGTEFKVQRIQRPDGTEIAFPRADFGAIPPSVQETSWKEHLQAIRDGKRQLLKLETTNSYTYEMTADDGTKDTFYYGGAEPLEAMLKRSANSVSSREIFTATTSSIPAKHRTTEVVIGVRPQGNCSLSGTARFRIDRQADRGSEDVPVLQRDLRLDIHQHGQRRGVRLQGYPQGAVFLAFVQQGRISGCGLRPGGQAGAVPRIQPKRRRTAIGDPAQGQSGLPGRWRNSGRKRKRAQRHPNNVDVGVV